MQLVKYDAACKAISEARLTDEVMHIRDNSIVMKAYARQAKNKQLEEDAIKIRYRAERRLGELIKAQKETIGLNPGSKGQKLTRISGGAIVEPPENNIPTLADAGIDKKLSARAQKLAAIPHDEFESILSDDTLEKRAISARTIKILEDKGKVHVSNNSGENEWYTPSEYIESARRTMGSIDLDPASSMIANKTVKAEIFYTKDDNGLEQDWHGNVWLNPPYAQPLIDEFSSAVIEKREQYNQICILVNNATDTAWFQRILAKADAACFIKGRIKFIDQEGNPSGAPLQGQTCLYIGENIVKFQVEFMKFGAVMRHVRSR